MTFSKNTAVALCLSVLLLPTVLEASSLEGVMEKGRLTAISFRTHDSRFVRVEEGKLTGFDYSIMSSFAKSLGVELEILFVDDLDQVIPTLQSGAGDVIIGALTITSARDEVVDFSDPYFPVVTTVVTRGESSIQELEDLQDKVCSTILASSMAEKALAIEGVTLHPVHLITELYEAVSSGQADFSFLDSVHSVVMIDQYPDLEIRFQLPGHDSYGYAVGTGSDLKGALDAHLAKLEEQEMLLFLAARHFGSNGPKLFNMAGAEH